MIETPEAREKTLVIDLTENEMDLLTRAERLEEMIVEKDLIRRLVAQAIV